MNKIPFEIGNKIKLKTLMDLVSPEIIEVPVRSPKRIKIFVEGWTRLPIDEQSKSWFQNTCWCAGGKCERCKEQRCTGRNWKERGLNPF